MKLRTEIMNTKKANQIECFDKVIKLTEEIKNTSDTAKLKQLQRQRRNILYNFVHNK